MPNTEPEQLLRDHDRSLAELQRLAAFGSPYGSRVNAEQNYSATYQALFRAGIMPQIRKKYR